MSDLLGFKELVQESILSLNALLSLALVALMKCVLLISLFKNYTVKFCEETQPIFVLFFLQCWDLQRSQPLQSSSKGDLTQGGCLTLLSTPHSSKSDCCNKISLVHHPLKYFMPIPIFEIIRISSRIMNNSSMKMYRSIYKLDPI